MIVLVVCLLELLCIVFCFFFFSSRRRHTRYWRDWSSDVCSSDLQVFKTLVARGDRHGVCFAVVPGDQQLDLKALAALTGDKKIETVGLKEVQPLTGYIRGGARPSLRRRPTPFSRMRPSSSLTSSPSRPV